MMKFKSLFRRGQQSHSSHQKQHRQRPNQQQQQQQVAAPQSQTHQQAPATEPKTRRSSNDWLSSSSTSLNYRDSRSNGPQPVAVPKNQGKIQSSHSSSVVSTTTSTEPTRLPRPSLVPPDCVARMQELERENEALRMERARLEQSYRNADTRRFEEQMAEISHLKEQHNLELEHLAKENEALRSRLRDVVHSPLSDSEKQQLLDASRLHNSAPASIAVLQEDSCAGSNNMTQENARSTTPEWDKRSTSSEVSVACLQDRILQMEETHYSTNEELQATIQELSDLQAQLTELQADNERLAEEKGVLLESLCRQTEKLEDSRSKVDTLQGLLLRDEQSQESRGYNTEREQKLVDLLKSAQEERESLLRKQEELTSELNSLRTSAGTSSTEVERLTKRVHFLESTIDSANVERKLLDLELAESKQEGANRSIEISKLASLLDNARAKIEELEQSRQLETKSEADEMLDAARREKDTLETQAAALQEQLSRSHCDHDRLKDQYSQLQEEFKVARNNAKSAIAELEYRLSQLKEERMSVNAELQLVRDSLAELQLQCQRHLEDKREMKAVLSELQRREREAQGRQVDLECALAEERRLRQEENAEWQQFQTDLLMTVRVANDFKTEAQSELERVVMENKAQRDKLKALEAQLDKLNNMSNDVQKSRSTVLKRGRTIIRKRFEPKKMVVKSDAPRLKGILKHYVPKTRNVFKNHVNDEQGNSVWFCISDSLNYNPEIISNNSEKNKVSADIKVDNKFPFDDIALNKYSNGNPYSPKDNVPMIIDLTPKIELEPVNGPNSCVNKNVISQPSEETLQSYSNSISLLPKDKYIPKIIDSTLKIKNDKVFNQNSKFYLDDENKNSSNSVTKESFSITDLDSQNDSLDNITGIENVGKDVYSINVSNSRFFVPNNYVFTDYEKSMDDLSFKVDPGVTKALRKSLEEKVPNNISEKLKRPSLDENTNSCEAKQHRKLNDMKVDQKVSVQEPLKIRKHNGSYQNEDFSTVVLRKKAGDVLLADGGLEKTQISRLDLKKPLKNESITKNSAIEKTKRPVTENLQLSRSNFLRNSIHETQPASSLFKRHSFPRNSLELAPNASSRFPMAPKLVSAMRQKFEDLPSLRVKDENATIKPNPRRRYAGNFEDVVTAKPKPMPRRLLGCKSHTKKNPK